MLSISVMGVTIISRQFFSTLVGMGSISYDFEDELKISPFNFNFCRTLKRVHFVSNFCFFFAPMEYYVLHLEIWNG